MSRSLRMPDLNRVSIIGRLTRDPEIKYTVNKVAYCKLQLVYSKKYKVDDKAREDTCFIGVTCWRNIAEWINEVARKGMAILVEGGLVQNKWEDKEGNKKEKITISATRIQLLEWEKDSQHHSVKADPVTNDGCATQEESADDIPF